MNRLVLPLLLAPLLVGCATSRGSEKPLRNVSIPVRDPTPHPGDDDDAREDPPESEPAKPFAFPAITRDRLTNGVGLGLVRAAGSPFVEVRLTLGSAGSASDGERTGLAALTARLSWEGGAGRLSGREVAGKLAATGAAASLRVSRDAVEISLRVPKDRLAESLEVIASILREPKLDAQELLKTKRRARADRVQALRSDTQGIAEALLAHELFKLPTSLHPYASPEPTPPEVDKLTLAEIKAFWKLMYAPSSLSILVVGDLDRADARAACDAAFSSWKGGTPPGTSFTDPFPAESPRVVVADVPDAGASEVFIGSLAVGRDPEEWAALAVTSELLGGSGASRIALSLRDKTPLHGLARTEIVPLARGPLPWIARASAEVAGTGLVASAMLDEVHRLAEGPPTEAEVSTARRRLADGLALRTATARGIADFLVLAAALGLPDDFVEKLPARLRAVDTADVQKIARGLEHGLTLVVIGDGAKIAPLLRRMGDVTVLAPERGFERVRTLPVDHDAPLVPPPPKAP